METVIIGQGFNLGENTSVGRELIEQFNSERYDSFTCLVAFASYGGISALTPYIEKEKKRGVAIKVILGVDQKGTSKEALEEVLSWGVDALIYHTRSVTIFHPKVYLFENVDIFTLIVGSNNLTEMGLVKNIECSLMIKDIKSNPVRSKFYDYWKPILDGTETNLYPITRDLIDRLSEEGIVVSESRRAQRHDDGSDSADVPQPGAMRFGCSEIQPNPEGFAPKRLVKVRRSASSSGGEAMRTSAGDEVSLPIGQEVLIAEIGGGPRWKQVNFPVEIFETFFGVRRGDNTYAIKLTNIAADGTLGSTETRQAVSVKSGNYRFEIGCAETQGAYPGAESRPIGLFVKVKSDEFLYQVLLAEHSAYRRIREYLYRESPHKGDVELKRHIVHVEAVRALYPELVI